MALKILVAEDNSEIADVYKKILSNKGHTVTITHDGDECAKLYKNEINSGRSLTSNPYDVVLVDFSMPKKDGMTLVTEILNKRSTQKIVFATAHIDKLRKQIHKIGKTVVVLNKPFTSKSLFDVLETKFGELGNKKSRPDGSTEWEKLSGSDQVVWFD